MYYIGLDVHKRKISYCVKDSGGKVYAEGSLLRHAWTCQWPGGESVDPPAWQRSDAAL
jgi:hypothetical protein